MSIKVALFGAGGYAKSYVNGFLELAEKKEVEFVACVVRTPSKVADSVARLEAAGVKIYPSADALYADWQDKLDLVCFPTGISSHESLTCDALKRGINVLCEKPVAGSVKAVRNMIAAEKEFGKFVMIGYQHMASPDILAVKKLIASGELGKVKKIVVEQLGVAEDQVTPEAKFIEDLGADSLDLVELVMALEEEFGEDIPDEDAEKLTTVGGAIEYIEGKNN